MAVHFPIRHFLVEHDLIGDYEIVSSLDGSFPVFYFGTSYYCSFDGYELGFVVVKSLLQSDGISRIIVVLVHNGQWSWLP